MGWQADLTRAAGLKKQLLRPGKGEGTPGPFFPGGLTATSL
eukprot:bmy_09808T0